MAAAKTSAQIAESMIPGRKERRFIPGIIGTPVAQRQSWRGRPSAPCREPAGSRSDQTEEERARRRAYRCADDRTPRAQGAENFCPEPVRPGNQGARRAVRRKPYRPLRDSPAPKNALESDECGPYADRRRLE